MKHMIMHLFIAHIMTVADPWRGLGEGSFAGPYQ